MLKMKKSLALLCLVFSLSACDKKETPPSFEGCLLKETNFGEIKHEYLYDRHSRLIEVKRSAPSSPLMTESYKLEYDNKGNPVKYSRYGRTGELFDYYTYEYNATNQLVKRNVFRRWNGSTYEGPITHLESHEYEYSPTGQLQRVNYGWFTSEYEYLGGNRIKVDALDDLYILAEIELDEKNNPFFQLSPGLAMIIDDFLPSYPEILTPHNVVKRVLKDPHGNVISSNSYTKEYEYNSEDLPIKTYITAYGSNRAVEESIYTCSK
jgi:hypothetical protein